MKTPIQEMYDQLKAARKDEYGLAFAIDMLLENEQAMLEKEKEVMYKAYNAYSPMTFVDGSGKEVTDGNYVKYTFNKYYNETFNTKEK